MCALAPKVKVQKKNMISEQWLACAGMLALPLCDIIWLIVCFLDLDETPPSILSIFLFFSQEWIKD